MIPRRSDISLETSLCCHIFEKKIKHYSCLPNFKFISTEMSELCGQVPSSPCVPGCVCYPNDPMWNRVKNQVQIYIY